MNRSLLSLAFAFSILPVGAFAEAPKIDHVVDLLHQAKASQQPVPLLEEAHNAMKSFTPVAGGKETRAGIGERRRAGNAAAGQEHKKKALEAIAEAIQVAKSGGDPKSKIENAVAMVHEAGSLKD